MQFWQHGRKFPLKVKNSFAQSLKKIKHPFKTKFSPKSFSGHRECSFDNPAENFSREVLKILGHRPQKTLNFFESNFQKTLLTKMFPGHVESSYDNHTEKFSLKVGNSLLEEIWKNFVNFSNFFPTMFLWTRKMPLWHTCRKFFSHSTENLRSSFKKYL